MTDQTKDKELDNEVDVENIELNTEAEEAVDNTAEFLTRVSETARIGTRYESDDPTCQNIRIWCGNGFSKYLIFYRVENSTLQILRVLHGARDYRNIMENEKSESWPQP